MIGVWYEHCLIYSALVKSSLTLQAYIFFATYVMYTEILLSLRCIKSSRQGRNFANCTEKTTCELMMIDDIIEWVR